MKLKKSEVLVLKSVEADMTAYSGFKYPECGEVVAPDWDSTPECGNGLHGFLWGEGDGSLACWNAGAKWLVLKVDAKSVVNLSSNVKFPKGTVVFCGSRFEATQFILKHRPQSIVIGATVVSGYYGTATSGDYGAAISGYEGKSTSGYKGTSTSGDWGTSASGDYGTSTSGYAGTSTSGDYGKATSGYAGTSTSGNYGTSTSGDWGTATSGAYGTATSGKEGTIIIKYFCNEIRKYKVKVGYIGEEGLEADVPYRLNADHNFVKAS